MSKPLILSTCTKEKASNGPPPTAPVLARDFLGGAEAWPLAVTRERALALKGSGFDRAQAELYALDRYVLADNTYAEIFTLRDELRGRLEGGTLGADWFFLSGGYGIVHALEPIRTYNATFRRVPDAPFTGDLWGPVLPNVLDDLLVRLDPSEVLGFFVDEEYREFVRQTKWFAANGAKCRLDLPISDLTVLCRRLLENK